MRLSFLALLLGSGLLAASPGAVRGATATEDKQSALEIFDAALAKFESDRAALKRWQYHQTLTTHQLDGAGAVVAKGTWRSIVRPGDPRPLEYLSEKREGKLSFFKPEADQPAAEKPGDTGPAKAKAQPEEKNQTESIAEAVKKYNLRDRYIWTRMPNETVAGESAYVLSFTPKANQNTKSREERFFGLLAGQISISREDFTILKMKGALQAPSQLFWIIARVTTFQFTYELEPARGNRLLRRTKATAKTVVTFPLHAVRQRHWLTVDRYEPRSPRGRGR